MLRFRFGISTLAVAFLTFSAVSVQATKPVPRATRPSDNTGSLRRYYSISLVPPLTGSLLKSSGNAQKVALDKMIKMIKPIKPKELTSGYGFARGDKALVNFISQWSAPNPIFFPLQMPYLFTPQLFKPRISPSPKVIPRSALKPVSVKEALPFKTNPVHSTSR